MSPLDLTCIILVDSQGYVRYEGNNINRNVTLRNQLKNVKIQNSDTIQSYFTRVAQIKEQLEVVEENAEEGEIVMTS